MAERVDLSEFDLDSLIGSCSPAQESSSSADDFLSTLDCPMELDSFPEPSISLPTLPNIPAASLPSSPTPPPSVCPDSVITVNESESFIDGQEVPSPPPCVPEPQDELEIKSEPTPFDSSSPTADSPCPAYTLDLGSEVDVSESEVTPAIVAVVPQVPRFVVSLSPTRIVLVLGPKSEIGITTATVTPKSEVILSSSPQKPSRSGPYPEPKHKASPPSDPPGVKVKSLRGDGENRVTLKAPRDKKSKKMEQNKTAATRYRQKKRAEIDALSEEHLLLERKNVELTEKAESMAREIEYLKELMEEVRTTRINKGLGADP